MKNLSSLLLALFMFAGCATDGMPVRDNNATTCENKGLVTRTNIQYGDSRLFVTPLSHIRRGYEWTFNLVPQQSNGDPADYPDSEVIIKGDASAPWLDLKGRNKENRTLTICVPANLDPESEFKFDVTVENVGYLDPRAKVL